MDGTPGPRLSRFVSTKRSFFQKVIVLLRRNDELRIVLFCRCFLRFADFRIEIVHPSHSFGLLRSKTHYVFTIECIKPYKN